MMVFKRGDIVLVPFPFTDQTTIKQRVQVFLCVNARALFPQNVVMCTHSGDNNSLFR